MKLLKKINRKLKAVSIFLSKLKGTPRKPVSKVNESSFVASAEICWIRAAQLAHFPEIFDLIKNSSAPVSANSRNIFREQKFSWTKI